MTMVNGGLNVVMLENQEEIKMGFFNDLAKNVTRDLEKHTDKYEKNLNSSKADHLSNEQRNKAQDSIDNGRRGLDKLNRYLDK